MVFLRTPKGPREKKKAHQRAAVDQGRAFWAVCEETCGLSRELVKGTGGTRRGTGGLTPAGVSPSIHPPPDLSTLFLRKHPHLKFFWVRRVDRAGNRAYTTLLEKEKTPHVRGIPLGLFARNHGTNRRQP